MFAAVLIAAWMLGARAIANPHAERRRLALAGALFVMPWALIVFLWVGIGAPFQATPIENQMRFLLLLANSILVTSAFVVLKEELGDAGERFYSTLGFVAGIPAGVAYLGCMSLMSAGYVARLRDGQAVSMGLLSDVFDVLEFTACVLTYLATAAFATGLAQTRLLGRGAARAYVIVCGILVLLLVVRGVSYPEMNSNSSLVPECQLDRRDSSHSVDHAVSVGCCFAETHRRICESCGLTPSHEHGYAFRSHSACGVLSARVRRGGG